MDSCYGKAKVNEWYKWVDTQITACYLEAKAAKQKHAADMQDAAVSNDTDLLSYHIRNNVFSIRSKV